MQFDVKPSVYEPREDSHLMQIEVQKRAKDKYVLDMGTGSGIQAITAAKYGAKHVVAVDINPKAVGCCLKNAKKHNVSVKVITSHLFENVPKKKFDLIVFNPPYLPSDGENDDARWSGGYEGIETILEFFQQVSDYLAKDGEILFIFSSHANQDKMKKTLQKFGYNLEIVATKRIFFEEIYLGLATNQ
jgi:release factor glutamine methyltransferase